MRLQEELSPEVEEALRAHCQSMTLRGMRLFIYFLMIGAILCWPTDLLIFPLNSTQLHSLAFWRATLIAFCASSLIAMRSERVQRSARLYPAISMIMFICATTSGYVVGNLGGLEEPFVYTIYCFAGVSAAFFVAPAQRILMTYGISAIFFLTYFAFHPEYLRHPRLLSLIEVCAASDLAYIMLGHVVYVLVRKSFLQGLELERKAAELAVAVGKSERLLLNILPSSIASRLKEEQRPIADGFANVTVLFADIVGFTQLSTRMQPEELVELLNQIFSEFDDIAEHLGLEKIKTIGDAYMVASGLPHPRTDHAEAIADMALAMRDIISRMRARDDIPLRLRVGIHTGPVVAGVIGWKKFIYDLWGDTVNTASRMESHGLPDEIQVSDATHRLLAASFVLVPRGEIEVKGIGRMQTWLLKAPSPERAAQTAPRPRSAISQRISSSRISRS